MQTPWGLGLITVRLRDGFVEVHCDPAPFKPRKSTLRKTRLLREFARRVGDPSTGGATRSGLVTAYRQDALRCAAHLAAAGPCKGSLVAKATGVPQATRLMATDHYGWFERVETGIYALTDKGGQGLKDLWRPSPRSNGLNSPEKTRRAMLTRVHALLISALLSLGTLE